MFPLSRWTSITSSLNHEDKEIALGSSFASVNVCCWDNVLLINYALAMRMYTNDEIRMVTSSKLLSFTNTMCECLKGLWEPQIFTIQAHWRLEAFWNICVFKSYRSVYSWWRKKGGKMIFKAHLVHVWLFKNPDSIKIF